ncbi:hypothetical protein ScPMuIL_015306 [Solemya velum]
MVGKKHPVTMTSPQKSGFHTKVLTALSCQKWDSTGVQVDELDEPDCLYKQITLEVKGHDPAVLRSYEQFVVLAANELDIEVAKRFVPPKVITRYTLLKSVHIFKKHRVQYEMRTHYKVIESNIPRPQSDIPPINLGPDIAPHHATYPRPQSDIPPSQADIPPPQSDLPPSQSDYPLHQAGITPVPSLTYPASPI